MAKKRSKEAPPSKKRSRSAATAKRIEQGTQEIGHELWEQFSRRRPTVFERRWWLDHILEWAMHDESVKVQMFRFVDVLPTLRDSESVARHLHEYFEDVRSHLPAAVRLGLDVSHSNTLLGKALAINARMNARKMAERFIAGTKPEEVFASVTRLRRQGLAFTLDLLGEAVISEPEADAYQQQYIRLIEELAPRTENWAEDSVLDFDGQTWLPRCQVSLKLSALTSHFNPMDPEGTSERVRARLRPIFQLAREADAFVHVDMEHSEYKDLTLQIFREICDEPQFRDWPHCGIVIQAYLRDAEEDLQSLCKWARKRGTPVWVRLVKGAYWDVETVHAEYRGWPCPVFTHKWETDANYERLTSFLMENADVLRPMIASHNLRSLANAISVAKELELPKQSWEIQMLHGMADEMQQLLSEQGYRVRVYAPFGEMLPGMSYLVRRLLENTSNDSFLRHAYESDVSMDEMLRSPEDIARLSEE